VFGVDIDATPRLAVLVTGATVVLTFRWVRTLRVTQSIVAHFSGTLAP
jgi:hypothetical protein